MTHCTKHALQLLLYLRQAATMLLATPSIMRSNRVLMSVRNWQGLFNIAGCAVRFALSLA